MNKIAKTFLILGGIAAVIIIGIITYLNGRQEVIVKFDAMPGNKVFIYQQSNPQKPTLINSGQKINLAKGDYVVQADGANIIQRKLYLQVSDTPVEVYLPISYKEQTLQNMLGAEEENLRNLISQTYPEQMLNYDITNLKLVKDGTWAVGKLSQKNQSEPSDDFIFVLHKTNRWQFAAGPDLTLSKYDYKNIPQDVLDAAIPANY